MAKKKVLVFGWYNKKNIGDDSFRPAMQYLWSEDFEFTNVLPSPEKINEYKTLVLGGGSFTDQPIPRSADFDLNQIKIPIAYIGVGVGSFVHPDHKTLLRRSKIIIVRDTTSIANADDVAPKHKHLFSAYSDLAVVLSPLGMVDRGSQFNDRRAVILMSDSLTPRRDSPVWQHDAHRWFMREFAKVLDEWCEQTKLYFGAFCDNERETDIRPAYAVTGMMDRYNYTISDRTVERNWDTLNILATAKFVVTQRYHGAIFAMMLGVPCILITSHDKMHSLAHEAGLVTVPYYGFTDAALRHAMLKMRAWSGDKAKKYIQEGIQTWEDLSVIAAKELGWSATKK